MFSVIVNGGVRMKCVVESLIIAVICGIVHHVHATETLDFELKPAGIEQHVQHDAVSDQPFHTTVKPVVWYAFI